MRAEFRGNNPLWHQTVLIAHIFRRHRRVQVILLTFKNFPSDGQQQGYCSKQAIENFIHVDGAVSALTPDRGVNWKLFSSLPQLESCLYFPECLSLKSLPCPPSLDVPSGGVGGGRRQTLAPTRLLLAGLLHTWRTENVRVLIPELRADWVVRRLRESSGCARAVRPVEGTCEPRLWDPGEGVSSSRLQLWLVCVCVDKLQRES